MGHLASSPGSGGTGGGVVWKEEKKFYPAEVLCVCLVQSRGHFDFGFFFSRVHTADPISREEPIEPVCGIWAVPGASH